MQADLALGGLEAVLGGRSTSCHSSSVGWTGFTAFHAAVVARSSRRSALVTAGRAVRASDRGVELGPDVGRHQVGQLARLGHEVSLPKERPSGRGRFARP
jgi:hypothetical protein